MSVSQRPYAVRPFDAAQLQKLAAHFSGEQALHPRILQLLLQREVADKDSIQTFLNPRLDQLHDPYLLSNMEKAVLRLTRALGTKERITIYGDYDVDGVTATALLVSFLRRLGAQVDYFIPHRITGGYGLNQDAMRDIAARGTTLLLTADCGISGHQEIELATVLGIDTIIIDHHHLPATIPTAAAVLNPLQPGDKYPFKGLCAVGVAFHLLLALRRHLWTTGGRTDPQPVMRQYLDLVALGTIADMVPLAGTNRVLVTFGMREIETSERPGIAALRTACGLKNGERIRSSTVAFRLTPKINAAGRLGDATVAVELLIAEDPVKAQQLAAELLSLNDKRKAISEKMTDTARQNVEALRDANGKLPGALVLHHAEWQLGMAGLVANQLLEQHGRPVAILAPAGEHIKGSVRAPLGYHVAQLLERCSSLLKAHGGHAGAGGLTLLPNQMEAFVALFQSVCAEGPTAIPPIPVDGELEPGELSENLMSQLDQLEPFGIGNPEPVFLASGVDIARQFTIAKRHLKMTLAGAWGRHEAIAFNTPGPLKPGKALQIAFTPERNTYRNAGTVQLRVHSLRQAEPPLTL